MGFDQNMGLRSETVTLPSPSTTGLTTKQSRMILRNENCLKENIMSA